MGETRWRRTARKRFFGDGIRGWRLLTTSSGLEDKKVPTEKRSDSLGFGATLSYIDITEFVVILNSEDAVRAFSQGGNVTIGGERSAAIL